MSDQPIRPGIPGRPRPAGAAPAAKGLRPAGARPAPAAPPPSGPGMRGVLMKAIILTCLILAGAIGWKVWLITHPPKNEKIDVKTEGEAAIDKGKGAGTDILKIQTKVWAKNEELKPEDLSAIKEKLGELREAHDKLKDLLDRLHKDNHTDSLEWAMMVPMWLQIKVWILDASDLLENPKPPEYGGLNIPMYLASDRIRKAQDELRTINTTKQETIDKNNPEEIKAVRKKITDLREVFRAQATKLQALDKYVTEGLTRPDLTKKEARELETLRDDANTAQQAVRAAGDMIKAFPE